MESTEEEKSNIKLYPIYKMLSWDLLFYYSIIFIFLVQIKHISPADVLLGEAFYPFFKFILLMPMTALIEKIGKKRSLIIANSANAISILCYILAQNFTYVLIGQFFSAIAFVIKGVAETNMLYDNLPRGEGRGSQFSKIDGKATSWYYYIDAITSMASGFLYVINGYLPLILCFVFCLVSVYISFKFKETEKPKELENTNTREYIRNLRHSFKYILQSKRLRYLIIFGAIFSGFLSVLVSLRSGVLEQIKMPEQYFGVIFAVLGVVSGISAKNEGRFHNRLRNKTLAVLALPVAISCIVIGFAVAVNLPYGALIVVILIMYLVQFIARGPFYTLIRRYLNNFTTHTIRNKISSSYNLIESIARTLIALLSSFLLRITTSSGTLLVLGCIITIAFVLLLDRMRTRVGLKPEQYKKEEIEFTEIK